MADWWLTIRVDGAVHLFKIGAHPEPDVLDEVIARARMAVGFPDNNRWVRDIGAGTSVLWSQGDPHPQLLAHATVHQLDELAGVVPTALADYRRRCEADDAAMRVEQARALLEALPEADRAALVAQLAGGSFTQPGR